MAYHIDPNDENAIVFDSPEKGIADSPYLGISDIRNMNIVSIPGESSVNFATSKIYSEVIANGAITSANAGTYYLTYTGAANIENGMAINFTVQSGLGVTADIFTTYWIINKGVGVFQIANSLSNFLTGTAFHVTNGTGTFTVYQVGTNAVGQFNTGQSHGAYNSYDLVYAFLDAVGQLWLYNSSNLQTASGKYIFAGASGSSDTGGCGLVYYQASDGTRWFFIFRSQSIDWLDQSFNWVWGWKPLDATTHKTAYLKASTTFHKSILGPDNKVYYCDGNWIGRFYQTAIGTPFNPGDKNTYTFDTTSVLPFTDQSQCLTFLANTLLIGARGNVLYPWDTFSQIAQYPIFVAESNCINLVTINTNAFAFMGGRGRIYITNGTNAQLYKKIPDHISGTVEPYFTWGGATSFKNQLYFSFLTANNAGAANNNYGGVWAIDIDTSALRLTNKLSFDTYGGYATALIPNYSTNPVGTGLYINWYNGSSGFGIDVTVGTPYTGFQASIDYDLIAPGTFLRAKTFKTVEYKLSSPLVAGESISIYYRKNFKDAFDLIFTSSTTGAYSDNHSVNFTNAQWIQLRAVTNSAVSSPSYVRLKEVRIK